MGDMYIDAELVLNAYKPLKLEKGMLFVRIVDDSLELYELEHEVRDINPYIMINGHPVEASLFEYSPKPDSNCKYQLATHNEIAWVDEGDDSEDMHEITIDDFNVILRNKMRCKVQIIDNLYREMCIPVYDEEKVIIRLIEEEE